MRDALYRLFRNKAAVVSLVFILVLLTIAVFAPLIAPYSYDEVDFKAITRPPSSQHWLGTDSLGRDVFSRLLYGARVSLSVSIIAQFVIILIGLPVGLISGFYGGWIDTLIQRVVDILYAFPSLLFIIVVMTFMQSKLASLDSGIGHAISGINDLSGGLLSVLISLGLVFWLTVSRLVRGETLSIKEKEFVLAAKVVGTKNHVILLQHILPNIIAPVVVAITFGIPNAIMIEAGLSFLGLGIKPPMPSWGTMISEGVKNIRSFPHLILSSGIALSLTLLAFNFLGDGLRDALDPSQRGKK